MRYVFVVLVAFLTTSYFASESQARSRFDVSIGFGSGGWCGDSSRVSFRYSDCSPSYRSHVHVSTPRYYCPPPRVIVVEPAYCPPPRVIYRTPVIVDAPVSCAPDVVISNQGYIRAGRPTYYYDRATYRYCR